MNIRSKSGYRHYCSECGALAKTTAFRVWPHRQAFCSKKCHDTYFSLKNIGLMLAVVIGYPAAIIAPWLAFFFVSQAFGFNFLGLLAGLGALAMASVVITWPISHWLDRLR